MNRYVEVIARDDDVRTAAIKMRDLNVNVIPVCDGARFAGILTDRDIAVRLAAEGYDATRTRVGEIMTRDLTYCYEDQTIDEAAIVMQFHQISRLPILDRSDELVGIVSMSDIRSCLDARPAAALAATKESGGFETGPVMETATARR
ncbi:MAG TPA: CBS domain-containing protein [Candidatus Binatia bacterium]|nr:CBS domain-containing protein [Candidatus Binatia bacterium]